MRKKIKLVALFLLLLVFGVAGFLYSKKKPSKQTPNDQAAPNQVAQKKTELTYLIDGFPLAEIPLYQLNKISSSKIFINTDPKNTSVFDESNFAYYNVVFDSNASQEELLNYYRGLMTQKFEEGSNQETVKGSIGAYKVSVSHYGDQTAYLQVYLPDYQDSRLTQYFTQFPQVFEVNETLLSEAEKSYGLLNQKGGELEFTKYFTVIDSGDQNQDGQDDVDEFALLLKEAQEKNQAKTNYTFDEKTATMQWSEQNFNITLAFAKNHQRLYLMLRQNI